MRKSPGWLAVAACLFAVRVEAAPIDVSAPLDVGAIIDRIRATHVVSGAPQNQPIGSSGTWTFVKRPSRNRDVTLRVHGSKFDKVDEIYNGLHLRQRGTGREFTYAGALFTDSAGIATRLEPILEDGTLSISVPASLLAVSAYPAVIEPLIGPEIDGIVPEEATAPVVTFDGTNYLIAWAEPNGVYCVRVTPEGVVLDPAGILAASAESYPYNLAVKATSNGSQFLITWIEHRLTGVWPIPDPVEEGVLYWHGPRAHILAARVDTFGEALDPNGILVSNSEDCGAVSLPCEWAHPSVAVGQDGTNFLVAWSQRAYRYPGGVWGTGYGIFGARLTPDGVVLDPTAIAISTPSYSNQNINPAVAFDGLNYFVVWAHDPTGFSSRIMGARVGSDGVVLDPASLLVSETGPTPSYAWNLTRRPDVTYDGRSFVVVWLDTPFYSRDITERSVHAARVSRDGEVLDSGGVFLGNGSNSSLAAIYDGRYTVVMWNTCLASLCSEPPMTSAIRLAGVTSVDESPWVVGSVGSFAVATNAHGTSLVIDGQGGRFITTWVPDTVPPAVFVPNGVWQAASSVTGSVVEFYSSALDAVYGPLTTMCVPASGSLFPPGGTQVTCTATDPEGNIGTASFILTVSFDWSGILKPLASDGSATFKAGSSIPVKFRLTGASAGITNLPATASLFPADEMAAAATSETLRFHYDPDSGQYVLSVGTRGLPEGRWQLNIEMGDGVERNVQFLLK